MSSCAKLDEQPIAADGGLEHPIATPADRDPYVVLDDLMTVVEALCPKWPVRESSLKDAKTFLL